MLISNQAENQCEMTYNKQTTLFDSFEDKTALKQLIQTGGDVHLDGLVAQVPLPLLGGVLKQVSSD